MVHDSISYVYHSICDLIWNYHETIIADGTTWKYNQDEIEFALIIILYSLYHTFDL